MSEFAIAVEHLGKRYTIGHQRARTDGIRHVIDGVLRSPLAWLRTRRKKKPTMEDFWALKDVSFNIKHGEVVGIIGRNGAGKSTLLKILSRITVPTTGRIGIAGRVASLLEVGTGFHQELTGRENIFLNGAILGMTRAEIIRKFDEIVAFSEIEDFLDTPVKRYSSGMYVRLAFAVAAYLEPEILIVDEVLAVGDAAFQSKCLGRMSEVAHGGRTVLFVSHNMDAVRTLCKRAILFEEGQIRADGDVESVVEDYSAQCSTSSGRQLRGAYGLVVEKVALKNDRGEETRQFRPGEDVTIEIAVNAQQCLEKPYFILAIQSKRGNCFTANMLLDGHRPRALIGRGLISCRFKALPLLPQRYSVLMKIRAEDGRESILDEQEVGSFSINANLEEYGFRGKVSLASIATAVVVPYEWTLPDGRTAAISLERSLKHSPSHHVPQPKAERDTDADPKHKLM